MVSSLYIHVPFCGRKCLFCSFVITVGQGHRRREYVDALAKEMQAHSGKTLGTVYLGGGTPSMLDEDHLHALSDALKENFLFARGMEMTIEANPETITPSKAKYLKALEFNRVSLGVQSLDNRYLKFLGRGHDADCARAAFDILRQAGFSNINLDLMYGFPGQSPEELQKDVEAISSLGSEHLSLYTLTIEPNSRFYAAQMKLDDNEKLAEHYLLTSRLVQSYGLRQYEVSNFAKPGFESRHNKNYWQGGTYIGLGVGAHGFDGRRRSWNTSNLQDYLRKATAGEPAVEGHEDLTDSQLEMEKVVFGLRMNEGIPVSLIPSAKLGQIQDLAQDGFLLLEKGTVKTTDQGRLVLDELSTRLI